MAFVIPPYVPYPAEISPAPSRETVQPPEGKQYAPLEFDWQSNGTCQVVDMGSRCTRPFSQIIMLDVDNTACSIDAQFLFPDSQTTLTVPAGTEGRYPVTTSGIRFYARAMQTPLTSDTTRVAVLNYLSHPVDLAGSEYILSQITLGTVIAAGSTQIIPAGTDGVATNVVMSAAGTNSGGTFADATVYLRDGDGNNIAAARVNIAPNTSISSTILTNIADVKVRFHNGLSIVVAAVTGTFGAGEVDVSVYYLGA